MIGYINDQNSEPGKNLLKWNIAVVSKKKNTVGFLDLGFGDIPLINRAKLKGLDRRCQSKGYYVANRYWSGSCS